MNFLRRGSKRGLVKEIHIASDAAIRTERVVTDQWQLNLHQPEPSSSSNSVTTLTEKIEKAEHELQRFKMENERLKNARILLEDKANYFEIMFNEKEAENVSLSTQIEILKLKHGDLQSEQSNERYQAKTQCGSKVEEELRSANEECRKTMQSLQKKMKKLQESHAKHKQDYALKVFALKDEKKILLEENLVLKDRLRDSQEDSMKNRTKIKANDPQNSESDEEHSCSPRHKLIIQLSQQVTTLDMENHELKRKLEKTKKLLETFKERGLDDARSKIRPQRQELCVNMGSLDLNSSNSKVELHG